MENREDDEDVLVGRWSGLEDVHVVCAEVGGTVRLHIYVLCCRKFLLGLAAVHPQCRDEGEGVGVACIHLCQVALCRDQCCCHGSQGHVYSGPQYCGFGSQ